jgi:hypothetical protein
MSTRPFVLNWVSAITGKGIPKRSPTDRSVAHYIGVRSSMRNLFLLAWIVAISAAVSFGQKGTAEPDYYPQNYSGDTWTGIVTAVNEETREFTLTFKRKDKEDTFVGVLPKGFTHKMADGTDREIKLPDLMGMQLRVYYMSKTRKVNDQKIKYNEVFKLKMLALTKP